MKFIELTIHTTTEASELVADVMWDKSEGGVSVCDVADVIALQKDSTVFWDYMDDNVTAPQQDVLVKCYLKMQTAQEDISQIMQEVYARRNACEGCINFGSLEETKREIEGDDWIEVWKKHFRPIPLGKIVVVPEWIAYDKKEGEEIILLDSNMAFGTGEHETTSMCVELLQNYLKKGDICIDVGCGSGILGIAAAKLGASYCYLTDLDPIAVQSATHNCQKNGVKEQTQVALSNLLDDSSIQGEVIVANITADVLAILAPSIPKNLKEGGTLILSGILLSKIDFVKQTYANFGFSCVEERKKGEWCALVLRR